MASSVVFHRFARVAGVAALAAAAWLGVAGVAGADTLQSGDERATAHPGNARPGDCAGAGLAGERIPNIGDDSPSGTYFDITSIPSGYTVTGVVVKGGDAYNVYLPSALGDLPWLKLHAPINASGGPAGLSHWFVCGTKGSTTTTTTTAPETTTTAPGGGESSTTTSPGGGAGGPSATTPGAPGQQGGEGLASTGFGNGWLVIVGGALLLGGGALLALVRGRSVAAARRQG